MSMSRTLCPLDCGWHHDHNPTEPINPTAIHFYNTQPRAEAPDPGAWALWQMRTQFVEGLLRAHLETHELIEWVPAVQAAKHRAEQAEAAIARVRQVHHTMHSLDGKPMCAAECETPPCPTIQALEQP